MEILEELQHEVCSWADATFGRPITARVCAKRLVMEAEELVRDPRNVEEAADCLILLLQWARNAHHPLNELVATLSQMGSLKPACR